MASIIVLVSNISVNDGTLHINGIAKVDALEENIGWGCDVAWDTAGTQINIACLNAAIAAAKEAGVDINKLLDKKVLFSGSGDVTGLIL